MNKLAKFLSVSVDRRKGGMLLAAASFAALVSFSGPVAAQGAAPSAEWQAVLDQAKKDGRIVWYTATTPVVSQRIKDDFEKAHPGISLEFYRFGTGQLISKLDQERQTGVDGADVHISSEVAWFEARDKEGALKPLIGPSAKNYPAKSLIGKSAAILGLEPMVLVYNTNNIKTPPTGPQDLLKPEYKGRVGLEDLASNTVIFFYDWLEKWQGSDYLKKLAEQKPKIYSSTVAGAQMAAAGEVDFAYFVNAGAAVPLVKQGAPINFLITKPAFPTIYGGGTLAWAKRPAAAQVFVDYLMSPRGQTAWHGAGDSASPLPNIAGSLDFTEIAQSDRALFTPEYLTKYRERWNALFKN